MTVKWSFIPDTLSITEFMGCHGNIAKHWYHRSMVAMAKNYDITAKWLLFQPVPPHRQMLGWCGHGWSQQDVRMRCRKTWVSHPWWDLGHEGKDWWRPSEPMNGLLTRSPAFKTMSIANIRWQTYQLVKSTKLIEIIEIMKWVQIMKEIK